MFGQWTLALALMTAATPALSLSCMRPDAVRMYEYARDSEDVFYVIKGRVTPTKPYTIPVSQNGKDASADTLVRISGVGLGRTAFSTPVEIGATVRLSCLSVWCARPPSEDEHLMIIKKMGEELTLGIGPCGGATIPWTIDAEKRLLECHQTNNCKPAEF